MSGEVDLAEAAGANDATEGVVANVLQSRRIEFSVSPVSLGMYLRWIDIL